MTLELPERLSKYLRKSHIALALSDTSQDAPLVLVNKAFCDLTGYTEDEVLNRNCRFLQGENTTEEMRAPLHDFVHGKGPDAGRFPILNYRKDGTPFHNYVYMSRLRDSDDEVKFILASQFDMTSALQRSTISANDEKLRHALSDLEQISREYGLAMMGSAKLLADSVAMMAQLSLTEK
ncbi:PAS domain-containing protein [Pseudooceanicola sp. MF1-13]|uniref:PAS domain-containing protein n=1 Tax=Pseudooceanicola sp. MF1-13 TaxID=3379095 RepID=UPI0038919857